MSAVFVNQCDYVRYFHKTKRSYRSNVIKLRLKNLKKQDASRKILLVSCFFYFGLCFLHDKQTDGLYICQKSYIIINGYATLYRKLTDAWGLTFRGSRRPGLTGNMCFSISLTTSGGRSSRLRRRYSLQM